MSKPHTGKYSASLDRFAVVVTWMVSVLLLGQAIGSVLLVLLSETADVSPWALVAIVITAPFVVYMLWLYRIRHYELTADSLIIRRSVRTRIIPLQVIEEVLLPDEKDLKWTLRLFANGGVFGYTGFFTNPKFGRMSWYATRRKQLIMLRLKSGEKVVITPDDMNLAVHIKAGIDSQQTKTSA